MSIGRKWDGFRSTSGCTHDPQSLISLPFFKTCCDSSTAIFTILHPIIPLRLLLEPKTEDQLRIVHIDIYVCSECMVVLPYITGGLRLNSQTAEHTEISDSNVN